MADPKTLVYLSSKYHRIYDRCKNTFIHNKVTVNNTFGKFDSKSNCLDFTTSDNKGLVFENKLDISNEAFTIAAWIKLTAAKDGEEYKFCFVGNKSSVTDLDSWLDSNDEVVSSETVTPTDTTTFLTTDTNLVTGAVLNDKEWHYITITRIKNKLADGTDSTDTDTILSMIDGKKVSSTTLGTDKTFVTEGLSIGSSGETDSFIGYMDDFVFIKDINLWTDEFAVPTDYLSNLSTDVIGTTAFKNLNIWKGASPNVIKTSEYPDVTLTDLLELEKPFQMIVTTA